MANPDGDPNWAEVPDARGIGFLEDRELWRIHDFEFVDEPLLYSLIKYNSKENRTRVENPEEADVSGSLLPSGKHKTIIDLDFNHRYVKSTTGEHAHLYLNIPISKFRWFVLQCALRYARVVEPGFFLWSIRRGQNFARLPGVEKQGNEKGYYSYGWLFKKRPSKKG